MNSSLTDRLSRRRVIRFGLLVSAVLLASRAARPSDHAPACRRSPVRTPPAVEGPFYRPGTPLRTSLLEPGLAGERVVLEGRVVDTACRPVAGAVVDLWHADAAGEYDLAGYRCRGHQLTDAAGQFRFETVVPGRYGSRTRHFHVKVGTPEGPLLTTQLYFPGEPRNAADPLFDERLLVVHENGSARYDFVIGGVG